MSFIEKRRLIKGIATLKNGKQNCNNQDVDAKTVDNNTNSNNDNNKNLCEEEKECLSLIESLLTMYETNLKTIEKEHKENSGNNNDKIVRSCLKKHSYHIKEQFDKLHKHLEKIENNMAEQLTKRLERECVEIEELYQSKRDCITSIIQTIKQAQGEMNAITDKNKISTLERKQEISKLSNQLLIKIKQESVNIDMNNDSKQEKDKDSIEARMESFECNIGDIEQICNVCLYLIDDILMYVIRQFDGYFDDCLFCVVFKQ